MHASGSPTPTAIPTVAQRAGEQEPGGVGQHQRRQHVPGMTPPPGQRLLNKLLGLVDGAWPRWVRRKRVRPGSSLNTPNETCTPGALVREQEGKGGRLCASDHKPQASPPPTDNNTPWPPTRSLVAPVVQGHGLPAPSLLALLAAPRGPRPRRICPPRIGRPRRALQTRPSHPPAFQCPPHSTPAADAFVAAAVGCSSCLKHAMRRAPFTVHPAAAASGRHRGTCTTTCCHVSQEQHTHHPAPRHAQREPARRPSRLEPPPRRAPLQRPPRLPQSPRPPA